MCITSNPLEICNLKMVCWVAFLADLFALLEFQSGPLNLSSSLSFKDTCLSHVIIRVKSLSQSIKLLMNLSQIVACMAWTLPVHTKIIPGNMNLESHRSSLIVRWVLSRNVYTMIEGSCYGTELMNTQGHSNLTLIYLCSCKVNFAVGNSYPHFECSHYIDWRSLNYAFSCDAIMARMDYFSNFIWMFSAH